MLFNNRPSIPTDKGGSDVKTFIIGLFLCFVLVCTKVSQANAQDIPTIKLDTQEVILHPVLTKDGRCVVDLNKDNFRIFDKNVEQTITSFSIRNVPISMGIVYDVSGSIKEEIGIAQKALYILNGIRDYRDEYFLTLVSSKAVMQHDFTNNFDDILNGTFTKIEGQTALLDAVYISIQKLKEHGHNEKKVILIISDGQDNNSRYSQKEVENALKESDITIISLWIYNGEPIEYQRVPSTMPGKPDTLIAIEDRGWRLLETIALKSGGSAHRDGAYKDQALARDVNKAEAAFQRIFMKIALEMRLCYTIAYTPSTAEKGWHRIKIQFKNLPKGYDNLAVQCRPGYNVN